MIEVLKAVLFGIVEGLQNFDHLILLLHSLRFYDIPDHYDTLKPSSLQG